LLRELDPVLEMIPRHDIYTGRSSMLATARRDRDCNLPITPFSRKASCLESRLKRSSLN
jgi:hypothetical protein